MVNVGFYGCQSENVTPAPTSNATDTYAPKVPTVSIHFGLGANLYKPRYDCLKGLGICRINAVLVEVDFYTRTVPVGVGVQNDTLTVVFDKQVDIPSWFGQDYMTVEAGDERIDFAPEVITLFQNEEGIDLSTVRLVQGPYPFLYDANTQNYYVQIPFVRN